MIALTRLPHVVTIVNPVFVTDRYGDGVADFGDDADHLEDVPAWVQHQSPSETYGPNRDAITASWLLILPPARVVAGVDDDPPTLEAITITGRSRVHHGEVVYEVDGEPNLTSSPRGPHHWEVPLKSVAG